jgi:hypothetical protein
VPFAEGIGQHLRKGQVVTRYDCARIQHG